MAFRSLHCTLAEQANHSFQVRKFISSIGCGNGTLPGDRIVMQVAADQMYHTFDSGADREQLAI